VFTPTSRRHEHGEDLSRVQCRLPDTLFVVHDTDVRVPETESSGLRRLDVTDIVRQWAEGRRPHFGFVLKGDERFRCEAIYEAINDSGAC
jgi:hypothetical protein